MQLHLPLNGEGPLRSRLYRDLRNALLDGRLQRGERLPPSRTLAGELGLSRQLVVEAYERLVAEGFLVSRPGSGTFVERLPPEREGAVTPVGVKPGAHWPMRPGSTRPTRPSSMPSSAPLWGRPCSARCRSWR